ncbi:MAG: 3-oxoacid CoA-transferase subunit B [Desulfobacterales bacterium]|jgi:3-oxoacid CoA-transferase B subunit
MSLDSREKIAIRAEQEISAGQLVNIGVGIPTLMLKYLKPQKHVLIHSENGILGMKSHCSREDADRNLIDAGGGYIILETGASFFDSVLSFSLVRGGRLDIAFLGALEISARGDLANWMIPGKYTPGIGGGMELAQKARRLIVTTTHTTRDGKPKILDACTLPLTAKGCVDRIITELAVIDVLPTGLMLREIATETDIKTVMARTEAELTVPRQELPRF